jgi:hypothetical protein
MSELVTWQFAAGVMAGIAACWVALGVAVHVWLPHVTIGSLLWLENKIASKEPVDTITIRFD